MVFFCQFWEIKNAFLYGCQSLLDLNKNCCFTWEFYNKFLYFSILTYWRYFFNSETSKLKWKYFNEFFNFHSTKQKLMYIIYTYVCNRFFKKFWHCNFLNVYIAYMKIDIKFNANLRAVYVKALYSYIS